MCCAVCAVCFLSRFAECRVLFAVRVPRLCRLHAHCDFFVLYVRFVGVPYSYCVPYLGRFSAKCHVRHVFLRAVCMLSVCRVSHVRN